MNERMFPIIDGPAIPWNLIAPHEQQALKNHRQTLERLSQRGGLSSCEAVAVLESRPWRAMQDGRERLKCLVETDIRVAATELVQVWERQCGRVFESMGSDNPRALAIKAAVDKLKATL